MDAANVDLKAFTERFYWKLTGAHLNNVLETLEYVKHQSSVWLELTTLLIPGENDSDEELDKMTRWVVDKLGPEVPMHFTAFHPDWKLRDRPATPPATLQRARGIALHNGVHYAYTGNVHDHEGGSTWCHRCGALLIERDWYRLGQWGLDAHGNCVACGTALPGVFQAAPGTWGARRLPVRMASYPDSDPA
jgi:pyruvate formate lyase activating enzyme